MDEEKPNCKHVSPLDNDASEIPKDSAAIRSDNNGRRAIVSKDSYYENEIFSFLLARGRKMVGGYYNPSVSRNLLAFIYFILPK